MALIVIGIIAGLNSTGSPLYGFLGSVLAVVISVNI